MNTLNVDQIEKICQHVLQCQLEDRQLESELIDHLCCEVEKHMYQGLSFGKALQQVLRQASIPELRKIHQEVESLKLHGQQLKKEIYKNAWRTGIGFVALVMVVPHVFLAPMLIPVGIFLEGFFWVHLFKVFSKIREKRQFDKELSVSSEV